MAANIEDSGLQLMNPSPQPVGLIIKKESTDSSTKP